MHLLRGARCFDGSEKALLQSQASEAKKMADFGPC